MAFLETVRESVRAYRFNSIFIRNYFVVLAFFVVLLSASSLIIYSAVYGVMEEEVAQIHENELHRIKDVYEMLFLEVENLIARLGTDPDIGPFLKERIDGLPNYDQIVRLQRIMRGITISRFEFLHTIYLYSELNDSILSSSGEVAKIGNFSDREWLDFYGELKSKKQMVVFREAYSGYQRDQTMNMLTYSRRLPFDDFDERGGALAVNIDADRLSALLATKSKTEVSAIVDPAGRILFSNTDRQAEEIARVVSEISERVSSASGKERTVSYKNRSGELVSYIFSEYRGLLYLSVMKVENYERRFSFIRFVILILVGSSVFLAIGISAFISVRIYDPIREIASVLENPDSLQMRGPRVRSGEVNYIETNILRIVDDARKLKNELDESLELTRRAQLVALQSQINPHFLYNTLQAINWMAVGLTGEDNSVSRSLITLSRLLMTGLDETTPIVPLSDELRHAELYIEIMKLRYRDRFEVVWDIADECRSMKCIKLTLQPLIENAFYHGIKPLGHTGTVEVGAGVDGDDLIVRVRDDGAGADPLTIDRLNADFSVPLQTGAERIGLRNINQRIKLVFGVRFGLRVSSEQGSSFLVEMRLPAERDGAD